MGKYESSIVKNTAYNILTSVVSRLGTIIFTIMIGRLLQPKLFGLYSLAISVIGIFIAFSDLGINTALMRYVSSSNQKSGEAKSYFYYLLKIKLTLTFALAFILIILAKPLANSVFNKPDLFYPILIGALYLISFSIMNFFEALFYVIGELKYITIRETINEILKLILSPLAILALYSTFKVVGLIAALSFAFFVSLLYVVIILRKKAKFVFEGDSSTINKSRVLKFLFFLSLTGLSTVFYSYIDTIMLGIFVSEEFIGFYRAAFGIVMSIAGFVNIGTILFPIFAKLEGAKLKSIFHKCFRYSAAFSFPAAFGLIAIAQPFIKIIYGESFITAAIPLCILAFLIVETTLGFYTQLFVAKEKPSIITKVTAVTLILNIILNYILLKLTLPHGMIYGVIGVSLATLLTRYSANITLIYLANKNFKIGVNLIDIIKPLFSSIVMFVALIVFQRIFNLAFPQSIVEILFGVIIYLGIMFSIKGLNKKDFLFVKSLFIDKILPRRFSR